ncbi:MAG: hypothetical protein ACXWWP_05335, partial [Candidatus Binatia bacterium]
SFGICTSVIPANAESRFVSVSNSINLDSRFHGNDEKATELVFFEKKAAHFERPFVASVGSLS